MENEQGIIIRQLRGETHIIVGTGDYPPLILEEGQEVRLGVGTGNFTGSVFAEMEPPKEDLPIVEFVDRDITVDMETGIIKNGQEEKKLTLAESKILELLLEKPGHVVSPIEFSEALGHNHTPSEAMGLLKVHMKRIRQKIDKDEEKPIIHNARSRGYYTTDNIKRHSK